MGARLDRVPTSVELEASGGSMRLLKQKNDNSDDEGDDDDSRQHLSRAICVSDTAQSSFHVISCYL